MPYPLLPPAGPAIPEPVDPAGFDLVLEVGRAVGSARPVPGTYPDDDAPGWTVDVVNIYGELVTELPNANPGTITKTLGDADEFSFASPKYDPATAEVVPLLHEAKIRRNGLLKAWGPIVADSAGSADGVVPFGGKGVWWYFRRRYFGTARRTNMITNGGFETGPATGVMNAAIPGWVRRGGARTRHWTAATKPGGHGLPDPLSGTKAVSMDNSGTGENAYISTRFAYRTNFPPGQRLTFAAWVYIADGWIGPAALSLGLYVSRIVGGIATIQKGEPIDDDTPRGEWVRLETSIIVPPRQDGEIEVRLYSPGGWVVWDSALSVLMESTGAGITPTDQVELAATVVRYGQTGRGKSPLNIGTDTPPTGVLRRRAWQHADHAWLADSVAELAAFPDGFDFDVVLTESTRTFRTYFPRKLTDRSATVVLRLGAPADGGNVASYTRSRDGGSTATSVIARGAGEGPDREEGAAIDASALGGLILEQYVEAPEDLLIGELDDYAEGDLEVRRRLVEVLNVTTHEGAGALIDLLDTGDLVRVIIDDGAVQIDDVYRVVQMVITCATDTLALVLNGWYE